MSASFQNAQGGLRWYRAYNTVEVVGLAYLFVLLFLVRQFGVGVESDPS